MPGVESTCRPFTIMYSYSLVVLHCDKVSPKLLIPNALSDVFRANAYFFMHCDTAHMACRSCNSGHGHDEIHSDKLGPLRTVLFLVTETLAAEHGLKLFRDHLFLAGLELRCH